MRTTVVVTVVATLVAALAARAPAWADGQLHATGRVRSAEPGPALAISFGTGYGYTEGVLDTGDAHHRIGGTAALAVRAARWLELGGELRGRYDKHTGAVPDDGFVGDPRLWARAGGALGGGRWLRLRLGLWLPGADAPSVEAGALSVDAAALFTWARGATAVTGSAGFRLDRSAASVDPARLSAPDRLGLGLSDANAVLLGAQVARRRGAWELYGEASWDLLVGDGAPAALESPLRVGLGARRALDASLTLESLVEVAASSRPALMDGLRDGALVAVEPRLAATIGVSWRPRPPAPRLRPRVVEAVPEVVEPPPPPPPALPTTGAIHGRVLDPDGAPLPGATIRLGDRTVTTGDDGGFTVADLAPGPLDLAIERSGHEPATQAVTVTAGADTAVDISLARVKPPSTIRGSIRSFAGKGLAAKVRIEPLGLEVSAGVDGWFSVDVPPGKYTVVVTMPGYDSQKQAVEVEEQAVTTRNIELRKARR